MGILKLSMLHDRITFVTPDQFAARSNKGYYWGLPNEAKSHRHYLLIIHSPTPPIGRTYAGCFDRTTREYYYIAYDDDKSRNNFVLLNLFLTMQAIAASPPLTPTIAVGPGGG